MDDLSLVMQLLPPFSGKVSDTVLTARAVFPFPRLLGEGKTGTKLNSITKLFHLYDWRRMCRIAWKVAAIFKASTKFLSLNSKFIFSYLDDIVSARESYH